MIESAIVVAEYAAVGVWARSFVKWYQWGLVALYEMWRDRDAYIPVVDADDLVGADSVVLGVGVHAGVARVDARDGAAVVAVA